MCKIALAKSRINRKRITFVDDIHYIEILGRRNFRLAYILHSDIVNFYSPLLWRGIEIAGLYFVFGITHTSDV